MSNKIHFDMNGKHFEFIRSANHCIMIVDGIEVDGCEIGSQSIKEASEALLRKNDYVDEDGNCIVDVACPGCGSKRKVSGSFGWWIYSTGKWCCDCGDEGTAFYLGDKISSLK